MTRLQSEFRRLYLPAPDGDATDLGLVGADGRVRAMVMELAAPPAWDALSAVWQGVQGDLGFPAPAIAVSGVEGIQLWFSLAEAVEAGRAHAFLTGLAQRYLADVRADRLHLFPVADTHDGRSWRHAGRVPASQPGGNWSAFVAQDLAPVFGESPWLDIPPGDEGQAALLERLDVTPMAAFRAAEQMLGGEVTVADSQPTEAGLQRPGDLGAGSDAPASDAARRFLLQAMNDAALPMALRIDAAKALLAHPERPAGT